MKSKIIKIGFLASFLIVQFFGTSLILNTKVAAANCTANNVQWYVKNSDGTNSVISGSVTADPNKTYLAVADFTNCQNQLNPVFTVLKDGLNFGNIVLASKITNALENHNAAVVFSQSGGYTFNVFTGAGANFNKIGQSPSLQVTATANTASTATTNDLQGYGQCILAGGSKASCSSKYLTPAYQQAYDSCIAAGNSAITCTTAGATCSGGPGKVGTCSPGYVCSAATGGTCSLAASATTPGSSPPASTPPAGGMAANSVTELINPIQGYDNLTALVVNIMKGFLGIIAVWAVAFIVIGGFKMVISSGNEEAVLSAKKTITWAVLGLLVAVLSFAIIAIVQNLVGVKVPPPPSSGTVTIPPSTVTIPPSTVTAP